MACGHGFSGQRTGEGTAREGDQAFIQQHEGGAAVPGSQLERRADKGAWPWRGAVARGGGGHADRAGYKRQ